MDDLDSCLNILPDEIWRYILAFLQPYEEWPVACTCKYFYEILRTQREKRYQCEWRTWTVPFMRRLASWQFLRQSGYLFNCRTSVCLGAVSPREVIITAILAGLPIWSESGACARNINNLLLLKGKFFSSDVVDRIVELDPDFYLSHLEMFAAGHGLSIFIEEYPERLPEFFKKLPDIKRLRYFEYHARCRIPSSTYYFLRDQGLLRTQLLEAIQANGLLTQVQPGDDICESMTYLANVKTIRHYARKGLFDKEYPLLWYDLRGETLPAFLAQCSGTKGQYETLFRSQDDHDFVRIQLTCPELIEVVSAVIDCKRLFVSLRYPQDGHWKPDIKTARWYFQTCIGEETGKSIIFEDETCEYLAIVDATIVLSQGRYTKEVQQLFEDWGAWPNLLQYFLKRSAQMAYRDLFMKVMQRSDVSFGMAFEASLECLALAEELMSSHEIQSLLVYAKYTVQATDTGNYDLVRLLYEKGFIFRDRWSKCPYPEMGPLLGRLIGNQELDTPLEMYEEYGFSRLDGERKHWNELPKIVPFKRLTLHKERH